MAGAKRFLSTVVTAGPGSGDGIWQNTTGKPLTVSLGAQAISTNRNACMSLAVGFGTTVFASTLGIASGNFEDYFGTTGPGANATGFSTVFGTFYLGCDCTCPGSYKASTSGIASFISADGTETKNWQAGHNNWSCCLCFCAGPYPDTSCSSWCANAPWGGQEWINPALSFYNEYTGLCWSETCPVSDWGGNMHECASVHVMGWTTGGTCNFGHCRHSPIHNWLLHECHGQDQVKASQTWVNHYCCCGKCNYENSSPGSMAICCQYNDYQCGGYYNWYALTNNQPDIVWKLWCCESGSCRVCQCENKENFNCYTYKCPEHPPGDVETFLDYNCRSGYMYCSCFCNQCGRWCRNRRGPCCISSFTDCYSDLCRMCCWPHWSNGWTCNCQDCPMNPYGGVAGAGTQCGILRHHKTMGECQMWFIGIHWACTWYCHRCSCNLATLDLWVSPPKYGTTDCQTNEYAVKYFSWNPQKCCTYLAIRSKNTAHCGIFSWFGSGQEHQYRDWQVGNSGLSCIWPCDTTYFKKVADFPSQWVSDPKYYTPIMCTTCIHRMEKCLWAIGVYNHTKEKFDPFVSSDLITWAASPTAGTCSATVICADPGNCIVEYMSTTCKWRECTSFDGRVNKAGILDWKLAFNNYERSGAIIDCNERLFVDNIVDNTAGLGTDFNLQIWGYEG